MNHPLKIYGLVKVRAARTGLPEIMLFQGIDLFNSILKHFVTSSDKLGERTPQNFKMETLEGKIMQIKYTV